MQRVEMKRCERAAVEDTSTPLVWRMCLELVG